MPSTVAKLVIRCIFMPPPTNNYIYINMDISFTITGDHVIMWAGFN